MAKKQPTFAEAFQELEKLTEWFEKGDTDLDESIVQFERGLVLAKLCKDKLAEVENKVITLKKKFIEIEE